MTHRIPFSPAPTEVGKWDPERVKTSEFVWTLGWPLGTPTPSCSSPPCWEKSPHRVPGGTAAGRGLAGLVKGTQGCERGTCKGGAIIKETQYFKGGNPKEGRLMTNKVNPNPDATEWTGGPSKTKGRFAQTVASGLCPGPLSRSSLEALSVLGRGQGSSTDRPAGGLWGHAGVTRQCGGPHFLSAPPQAPLSTSRENWEL